MRGKKKEGSTEKSTFDLGLKGVVRSTACTGSLLYTSHLRSGEGRGKKSARKKPDGIMCGPEN